MVKTIDLILMLALGLGLGYAVTVGPNEDKHPHPEKEKEKEKEKGKEKGKEKEKGRLRYVYVKRAGSAQAYTKYAVSETTTFAKLKKAIRHSAGISEYTHIDILYNGIIREGNALVYKYDGGKFKYTMDGY